MQPKFEVKYIGVTWYDQDTILSIQESFIPLKVIYDGTLQRFVCNTVIYPKADGIGHGQLAFRYLEKSVLEPYIEALDGSKIPLKKAVDKDSGKTWWIEGSFWVKEHKFWGGKIHRTAGKCVVGLQDQICQIDIGSSEFTTQQLQLYLADFKSDLWELILDENSYVSGEAKEIQDGGVSEESIAIINKVLSHAQQIVKNPKSELREIQALKPRKMVKPVSRTFMELATKGDGNFLTSRASKPSYNVSENQYILFALERVYKLLRQLVTISRSKRNRFEDTIKKFNERYESFSNEKKIDKHLVRKDLVKLKSSYELDDLNRLLEQQYKNLNCVVNNAVAIRLYYLKVDSRTGDSYFGRVKEQLHEDWFEKQPRNEDVFLDFGEKHYLELFQKDFEYEIKAEVIHKSDTHNGIRWHSFTIDNLNSIKIIGGVNLLKRKNKFMSEEKKAMELASNDWIKTLSKTELAEQEREKQSIRKQSEFFEEHYKKAKLVYDLLEPKIIKYKTLLSNLEQMGVISSSVFPNSMTFVQNPNYQSVHSGYKKIRELTNLADDDILLSLEKVEEIGLVNMPLLYERWCLLQIIKVLVQNYNYVPTHDWKRKLLKIISTGSHDESIDFNNSHVKRDVRLWYELTLQNGKRPDFIMDVIFQCKNDQEHKKRFVMDAKYYPDDAMQKYGGISTVIHELYHKKNYSEDGKNTVFIIHPAKNAISDKVSPQSWGKDSYLGELKVFDWDESLRKAHYHQYGAISVDPVLRLSYLDGFQRLLGMFLQYGIEDNQLSGGSDDVKSLNFCIACGSNEFTKTQNARSSWYECNFCKHFTTYNHCFNCNTRLIKNGDYWTYHSQMPMEPLNIKCPACESLL